MNYYLKFVFYNLLILATLFSLTKLSEDKSSNEYRDYYSEKRNEALAQGISMEEYSKLIQKSNEYREGLNEGQVERVGKRILLDTLVIVISFIAFLALGYISIFQFIAYASITTCSILAGLYLLGPPFMVASIVGYVIGFIIHKVKRE